MLNSEWKNRDADSVIPIDRDGEIFQHIYDYMFYKGLPRNELGYTFLEPNQLEKVKAEAEYYNLSDLVAECESLLSYSELEHQMKRYATVVDEIYSAKSPKRSGRVVYEVSEDEPDSLLSLLRKNPFVPGWITGKLSRKCNETLYKSTTIKSVNVAELVEDAKPSPFGRGTMTVVDTNVRNSVELSASDLNDKALSEIIDQIDVSSLAPNMKLKLTPYKLVIYREGGHFDNHRDTARGQHHIGTLVLILNSDYTGGELEISHGEQRVFVAGALNWVAMYGDCVHSIQPITSGTRVSLIFDIWNNQPPPPTTKRYQRDTDDDDSDAESDYHNSHEFWPDGEMNTDSWLNTGKTSSMTAAVPWRPWTSDTLSRIYAALDQELQEVDVVSICLEHLYPVCQANLHFLKGEDHMLYKMLEGKYKIGVTPITIGRNFLESEELWYREYEAIGGSKLLDMTKSNRLFVPNALGGNSILHYQPGIAYTGNEGETEELVYLVAALVVRKL